MKYLKTFLIFKLLLIFYVLDVESIPVEKIQDGFLFDDKTISNLTLEMQLQRAYIENLRQNIELVKSQNHLEVLNGLTPIYHLTILNQMETSDLKKKMSEFMQNMTITQKEILTDVKKSLEANQLAHFNKLENIFEMTKLNMTATIQNSLDENRIEVKRLNDNIDAIDSDIHRKVDEEMNLIKSHISKIQSIESNFNEKIKEQINLINAKISEEHNKLFMYLSTSESNWSAVRDADIYTNCAEATEAHHKSGVYFMKPKTENGHFEVFCDNESFNGGWIVIQRRQDGSVDFARTWKDYQNGFGNLTGEFFIGLDKLHTLTKDGDQELLIVLRDFDNVERYAKYDNFKVGGTNSYYKLEELGTYSGTVKDSFTYHSQQKFSTYDNDNDKYSFNCANERGAGGWWYNSCSESNLNGKYFPTDVEGDLGIFWDKFRGRSSLKFVQMMIRKKTT